MEIEGKIIKMIDRQTGTGQKGDWIKTLYLLETFGQYPKEICLTVWGDDIQFQPGITINASVDISSREYNGKYYTDIKVWKAQVLKGADSVENINEKYLQDSENLPEDLLEDDLPF